MAFSASWASLGWVAKRTYDRLLPGVPDAGRWPIASLPWLLARAATGGSRPWNSLTFAWVWLLAVGTLLVPVLVVSAIASSARERLFALFLSLGLASWALIAVFRIQYGYTVLFEWPITEPDNVWFVLEPMLWAAGICVLGGVIGSVANSMVRRTEGPTTEPD